MKTVLKLLILNILVTNIICFFVYLGMSFIEISIDFTKWPVQRREEFVEIYFEISLIVALLLTILAIFCDNIIYDEDEYID